MPQLSIQPRTSVIPFALAVLFATTGCAYSSFYKQTEYDVQPKPVSAKNVKIVRRAEDLSTEWTKLGEYSGKAPTIAEAMQAAQSRCGQAGSHFYILSNDPEPTGGGVRVSGACAVKGAREDLVK